MRRRVVINPRHKPQKEANVATTIHPVVPPPMRVFEPETVSLFDAHAGVASPKPALSKILELVKEGVITTAPGGPPYMVDRELFELEVTQWSKTNRWQDDAGDLPTGFVPMFRWTREKVGERDGFNAGLYNSTGKGRIGWSVRARSEFLAGAVPSARQVGTRHVWAAPPREIEVWLLTGYGLRCAP